MFLIHTVGFGFAADTYNVLRITLRRALKEYRAVKMAEIMCAQRCGDDKECYDECIEEVARAWRTTPRKKGKRGRSRA